MTTITLLGRIDYPILFFLLFYDIFGFLYANYYERVGELIYISSRGLPFDFAESIFDQEG
jgi:hypothetical protein